MVGRVSDLGDESEGSSVIELLVMMLSSMVVSSILFLFRSACQENKTIVADRAFLSRVMLASTSENFLTRDFTILDDTMNIALFQAGARWPSYPVTYKKRIAFTYNSFDGMQKNSTRETHTHPDPTDTKFCKKRAMRVDAFGRETTPISLGENRNPLAFSNDIFWGNILGFFFYNPCSTEDICSKYRVISFERFDFNGNHLHSN